MAEIGEERTRQVVWSSAERGTAFEVTALFEPLVRELFGDDSQVLGIESEMLKPVAKGSRLALSLKVVDKGTGGRVLWGRGLGKFQDGGSFAVVSLRILLPQTEELTDEF